MRVQEAIAAFASHLPLLQERGISWADGCPPPIAYLADELKIDHRIAMDATIFQPQLTTDPNSGVPSLLTTFIDPTVYEILFSPNQASEIFGEQRKGTWLDDTAMFPVVEHTGEVSSYGDRNENGRAGANTNWPQRQQYLYQTNKEYGERELARAGLARLNWVSEIDQAAATVMSKYENLTYFYGVKGLQNYGILNDPNLPAAITPSPKANGGVTWFTAGGAPNAQANEVYNDIVAIFENLVNVNAGLIDKDSPMTLAMAPGSAVALTFTNTFNVNVEDLLKKNFKNLKVKTAVQYGVQSAQNPQGQAAGNLVQLIADSVEGQKTGFCAFGDKLRSHPIIRATSSFRQKVSGGSWGAIIRMPVAFQQMVGV
jgi:hypothetical protein